MASFYISRVNRSIKRIISYHVCIYLCRLRAQVPHRRALRPDGRLLFGWLVCVVVVMHVCVCAQTRKACRQTPTHPPTHTQTEIHTHTQTTTHAKGKITIRTLNIRLNAKGKVSSVPVVGDLIPYFCGYFCWFLPAWHLCGCGWTVFLVGQFHVWLLVGMLLGVREFGGKGGGLDSEQICRSTCESVNVRCFTSCVTSRSSPLELLLFPHPHAHAQKKTHHHLQTNQPRNTPTRTWKRPCSSSGVKASACRCTRRWSSCSALHASVRSSGWVVVGWLV